MCKAIGAGLVESFGEGNQSVMHAMARTHDPSLTPTTSTGERPWLLLEPSLSLDLRRRIETWLELEDAGRRLHRQNCATS